MGIFQSDLIIRTAIMLGIEDIRNNPWLIDFILGDVLKNTYLRDKYGQNHIDSCKEWFLNNKIEVYMDSRKDRDKYPCVTISLGTSQEKEEMKTMADQSTETVVLLPNEINKPIPFIVKPFNSLGYNDITGEVPLPDGTDIGLISEGMILVDPDTAEGYIINDVSSESIFISTDLDISSSRFAIVPKNQFYKARIEHSFFQETYTIGCHVHGDPQAVLWLHSIVLFALLRYREGLLEANGFYQSTVNSSDLTPDSVYGGVEEEIWSRFVTLTGMVENCWVKSPRRVIESVAIREKTETDYVGGIKILSNENASDFTDIREEPWYTVEDE